MDAASCHTRGYPYPHKPDLEQSGEGFRQDPVYLGSRSKLEIGCIYLTLAELTATLVWDRLERCRSKLIQELGPSGLTNFDFHKDVAKVKILVFDVPF